jgi:hypothetical protein
MDKLKIIELFAGSLSFTKVARVYSCSTFTSDILPITGVDYPIDIFDFDVSKVPFVPDIIWASPDCAAWSKAAGNVHFDRNSLVPKTTKAQKAFEMIDKTLEIIYHFLALNAEMKYYIENPEGKLQKYIQAESIFSNVPRIVVLDQCQYGREFKKTTHVFTNDLTWQAKPRCKGRPMCKHQENKKDATGKKTQKKTLDTHSYYKRALIAPELCKEIILHNIDKKRKKNI